MPQYSRADLARPLEFAMRIISVTSTMGRPVGRVFGFIHILVSLTLVLLLPRLVVLAGQPEELRAWAKQIVAKVAIDNDAEFFDAWNLDWPGMEGVRDAVASKDYDQAKTALKDYFLQRRKPRWKINHWDMPEVAHGQAPAHSRHEQGQAILAHRFSHGGFDVDFGEKIEWNHFPLTLPNGNPDTEYPVIHNINRFFHLKTLGQLYWFSHDERYAHEFVAQITDHVQSNPAPEKYVPFTAVWSRLTACIPLNGSWLDGWNYFLGSDVFTADAMAIMLKGFIQKTRYAIRAPDAANRYMIQLTGIFNVGAYFPELKQADDFRRFGMRGIELAIEDEFYPDGMSKELCPGYHGVSRGAIQRLIENAALMGYRVPKSLEASLKRTFDVYMTIATPRMSLPQFGDTWGDGDLAAAFQGTKGIWDDDVHKWFASEGKEGGPPKFTSARLPWAGFYTMRSGWDKESLYLCFDAGPVGLGHFHEDYGNFECYAFGERLISDAGVNSYTVDKWHNYCYSSPAHNVVIVDGLSQARAAFPENHPRVIDQPRTGDWHSDSVFDLASGSLDAPWVPYAQWIGHSNRYGRDHAIQLATHRRDVCFVKDSYWIICDRLVAEGEHTYEQLFHLRPDRTATVFDERCAGSTNTGRPNVLIVQADRVKGEVIIGREDPPQGWVAVKHGQMAPAPCICFKQRATGGAVYDTVILPYNRERPRVRLTRLPAKDDAGDTLTAQDLCAICIDTPHGIDYFVNDMRDTCIGPTTGRVKTAGPMETDARTAVIRCDTAGILQRASAVGGEFLRMDGRTIWQQPAETQQSEQ